jgi:hypothetical protein
MDHYIKNDEPGRRGYSIFVGRTKTSREIM